MLKLGFITYVTRGSTFNDKIGKKPFNLRVCVKYRITEIKLFFCIFGDRDGNSIMGIKQKKKKKKKFLISYDKAILSLWGKFEGLMMDPKDLL